jgi:hypothetical protein
VAFKKRITTRGRSQWQIRVLDLETLSETELAEGRNVDDQVEWLDDGNLLYTLPGDARTGGKRNIWVVPANGTGSARVFLKDAESPAIVRPGYTTAVSGP